MAICSPSKIVDNATKKGTSNFNLPGFFSRLFTPFFLFFQDGQSIWAPLHYFESFSNIDKFPGLVSNFVFARPKLRIVTDEGNTPPKCVYLIEFIIPKGKWIDSFTLKLISPRLLDIFEACLCNIVQIHEIFGAYNLGLQITIISKIYNHINELFFGNTVLEKHQGREEQIGCCFRNTASDSLQEDACIEAFISNLFATTLFIATHFNFLNEQQITVVEGSARGSRSADCFNLSPESHVVHRAFCPIGINCCVDETTISFQDGRMRRSCNLCELKGCHLNRMDEKKWPKESK